MDLLVQLHERLIATLTAAPRSELPITVSELYQRFIPYRAIRHEIGVMELAAYEHALLRLLGCENG
jgi:hypothetical protein